MSRYRFLASLRRQSSCTRRPLMLEQLEDRSMLSATPLANVPVDSIQVNSSSYSASDILVKFAQTSTNYTGLSLLPGTTVSQPVALAPGWYTVTLSSTVTVNQALAAYEADPRVTQAQTDSQLSASQIPAGVQFSQEYGLQAINAPQAWDVTTGNPSVIVAVMDTGIDYNHPDLYSNIWINQAEIPASRLQNLVDVYHDGYISWRDLNNPINQGPGKITDINGDGVIDAADIMAPMILVNGKDSGLGGWSLPTNTKDGDTAHPNDLIGYNFVSYNNNTVVPYNNNPWDDNGHGTNVAGIIGASNQPGNGVIGVDPNVQLMDVKWMNSDGVGYLADYLNALNYALQHGAKIINNSWTGFGNDSLLEQAIQTAQQDGAIFVAAAGNFSTNSDVSPTYPASFPLNNVVAVAATDQTGALASYSDYGAKTVALAAPGSSIYNTYLNNGYTYYSGTSMAAPEVSGALALVWGQHPTWSYTQVINQVLNTVQPEAALKGVVKTGGLLNVAAAVGWVSADSTSFQVSSVANTTATPANNLSTLQVTFTQPIDPTTLTTKTVILTGPGGATIPITQVQEVIGSSNKQFNLILSGNQTTAGTYTLQVTSAVRNTLADALPAYSTTFILTAPIPPTPPKVLSVTTAVSGTSMLGLIVTFSKTIKPTTFSATAITVIGPNGRIIPITNIMVATTSANTQFLVLFAGQAVYGNYYLSLASGVSDTVGNTMGAYAQTVIFGQTLTASVESMDGFEEIPPTVTPVSGTHFNTVSSENTGTTSMLVGLMQVYGESSTVLAATSSSMADQHPKGQDSSTSANVNEMLFASNAYLQTLSQAMVFRHSTPGDDNFDFWAGPNSASEGDE